MTGNEPRGGKSVTDVTIRGIEDETYSQFAAEAKRRGIPIGELTTAAMKAMIATSTAPVYHIGNMEMLSVSKVDLESIELPVVLSNIEVLEFDDTVEWPTFNRQIKEINNVEVIRIHRSLSKFQVLIKAKNVETIESR
jgi:post-segregation antitoxin (ccd killing protein)